MFASVNDIELTQPKYIVSDPPNKNSIWNNNDLALVQDTQS